jgi:hypothetical protein
MFILLMCLSECQPTSLRQRLGRNVSSSEPSSTLGRCIGRLDLSLFMVFFRTANTLKHLVTPRFNVSKYEQSGISIIDRLAH